MQIRTEFWQGKRVLLTGHTGFKGSWLALWLSRMGAQVHGMALPPPSQPSLFDAARVRSRLAGHKIVDVRDQSGVRDTVTAIKPEILLHLAAQSLVRDSYQDPVGTYATNVMGTVHLLDAVRYCPSVRVVLIVTSDKCYENSNSLWGYREIDPMGGHDPYSSSKGCAELVSSAYRNSFFYASPQTKPNIASARAGNVIGGGDWAKDRLIPDLIRAFNKGEVPVIRSPHAVRPWQHVLEPLSGYLHLCQSLWENQMFSEGWNFGPVHEDARPVSWLADHLVRYWGNGASWQFDQDSIHPHEATYLYLDSSKAAAKLGYRPRWKLETALQKVVEWYKAYFSGADVAALSDAQIAEFQTSDLTD